MIEPSDKKRVKEIFSDWMELQDTRKELNTNGSELKKEAASILQIKQPKVTKLFNFMRKLYEEGEDELEDLSAILIEIKD